MPTSHLYARDLARAEGPDRARAAPARPRRSASSATASTTRWPCTRPTSGISVDTATDVAKDAADVVLLEKSLDVLADGVAEGRRIFANTIKYVLMGTSSNFGNMFSAAAASGVLPFLPMLPSQILLNNLLYDAGQLTIPTDHVDPEQLRAPSHWDIAFIRRFMLFFGPLSSLFDFLTFGDHARPAARRRRTCSVPAGSWSPSPPRRWSSSPSGPGGSPSCAAVPSAPLAVSTLVVVVVAAVLPLTPLAHVLGLRRSPDLLLRRPGRHGRGLPGAGRARQAAVLRRRTQARPSSPAVVATPSGSAGGPRASASVSR